MEEWYMVVVGKTRDDIGRVIKKTASLRGARTIAGRALKACGPDGWVAIRGDFGYEERRGAPRSA